MATFLMDISDVFHKLSSGAKFKHKSVRHKVMSCIYVESVCEDFSHLNSVDLKVSLPMPRICLVH